MPKIKTGRYQHFKGNFYEVIDLAQHTETNEKLVLYTPLYELPGLLEEYGSRPLFVRPYEMFFETVERDGKVMQRFRYVGEE